MANDVPALRLARIDEADEIDALMKASIRDIFPRFYGAAQTEHRSSTLAVWIAS